MHAQVPLEFCRADLSPAAKALGLAYWSHADFEDRTCYPSNATVMAEAGIRSPGSFRRARRELEEAGWLLRLASTGSTSLTFLANRPGEEPPWLHRPPSKIDPTPPQNLTGPPPSKIDPQTRTIEREPSNKREDEMNQPTPSVREVAERWPHKVWNKRDLSHAWNAAGARAGNVLIVEQGAARWLEAWEADRLRYMPGLVNWLNEDGWNVEPPWKEPKAERVPFSTNPEHYDASTLEVWELEEIRKSDPTGYAVDFGDVSPEDLKRAATR